MNAKVVAPAPAVVAFVLKKKMKNAVALNYVQLVVFALLIVVKMEVAV